jgi:hypothetical protein
MPCNQPSPATKKSLKVNNPSRIYCIISPFKEETIITYNIYKMKLLALQRYDSNCYSKESCHNWPDAQQECVASNVFIYPSLTLSLHVTDNITYTFPLNLCLKAPVWEFISNDDWENCVPEETRWWWGWWGWWWWGWWEWWWWWQGVPCRSIALYYNGFFSLGRSTELEQCLPDWIKSACKWSETDVYGNIRYFDSSCWYAFVFGKITYSPPGFYIPDICYYYISASFSIVIFKMCVTYNFKPTICPHPLNMKSFCTGNNILCTSIHGLSWGNSGCPQEATSNSFYWIQSVSGVYDCNNPGQLEVWY